MKSRLKKQLALCAAVVIVVTCIAILYMRLPRQIYSPVVSDGQVVRESTSEAIDVTEERKVVTEQTLAHAMIQSEGLLKEHEPESLQRDNDRRSLEESKQNEWNKWLSRTYTKEELTEFILQFPEPIKQTCDMFLNHEHIAQTYLGPIYEWPYYKYFKEIQELFAVRGYDSKKLYPAYVDFIASIMAGDEVREEQYNNATKTTEIIKLVGNNPPEVFMKEIESLFPDKKNVGYLRIRFSVHWAQGKIEDLFNDIKEITIAMDNFESNYIDNDLILYDVLDGASFWGFKNMPTEERECEGIGLGPIAVRLLIALEMDGKL